MKLKDGELVKWIGDNGGWCMGHVQTTADGGYVEVEFGYCPGFRSKGEQVLVKHALTGELEFIAVDALKRIPHRNEWEQDAEPQVTA